MTQRRKFRQQQKGKRRANIKSEEKTKHRKEKERRKGIKKAF